MTPDHGGSRHGGGSGSPKISRCGVGDTLALLMADRALGPEAAAVAKLGVPAGSILAGAIGVTVVRAGASQTAR